MKFGGDDFYDERITCLVLKLDSLGRNCTEKIMERSQVQDVKNRLPMAIKTNILPSSALSFHLIGVVVKTSLGSYDTQFGVFNFALASVSYSYKKVFGKV